MLVDPAAVRPPTLRRHCSRPACAEPAAATLSYDYQAGTAWVDVLTPERDPHCYDLCAHHAARVSVPHGWRLDDRRIVELDRLAG
jgi:hypothetical protein